MTKKIASIVSIVIVILFMGFGLANGQIKDRSSSYSYAGGGYTLVFFTNGDVNDTYPVFNLSQSSFLSEINVFYGMRLSSSVAVEFSPSFIFTTSESNDGFYFTNQSGERSFYYPNQAKMFALPVNLNVKFYPFAGNPLLPTSNIYFGGGAGMMYIDEEFDNLLYTDSTLTQFKRFEKTTNSQWTPNFSLFVGFGSSAKFGYGFELGYRFVPLDGDATKPQTTSIANNMNSVNLSAKVMISF